MPVVTTEEGQHVAFDEYTWKRRELDKRLPIEQPWPSDADIDTAYAKLGPRSAPPFLTAPSRILPDVYLVNTEPNLSYVIDAGEAGLVLVDPGMTNTVESERANIARLGLGNRRVRWVLNTHAHFDHAMADEEFRKTGAEVMIGAGDADAIEKGTAVTALYLIMPNQPYPYTKVGDRLADGEILHLGNKTIYVIATPGHTPGSSCFLLQVGGRNVLFGGDTALYDNRLGNQSTSFTDNREYLASLRKLAGFHLDPRLPFQWDVLLPGHGAIVMDHAYMDVEKDFRTTQIDLLEGYPIEALPFATPLYRKMMAGRP
nr:MBL fold metallo-hydrolase [Solimonas terrae]